MLNRSVSNKSSEPHVSKQFPLRRHGADEVRMLVSHVVGFAADRALLFLF
jgi:hypothetical protein